MTMKKISTPIQGFESRKTYSKPTMTVVKLQHKTFLLQESQTPPYDAPDYDEWLQ